MTQANDLFHKSRNKDKPAIFYMLTEWIRLVL